MHYFSLFAISPDSRYALLSVSFPNTKRNNWSCCFWIPTKLIGKCYVHTILSSTAVQPFRRSSVLISKLLFSVKNTYRRIIHIYKDRGKTNGCVTWCRWSPPPKNNRNNNGVATVLSVFKKGIESILEVYQIRKHHHWELILKQWCAK